MLSSDDRLHQALQPLREEPDLDAASLARIARRLGENPRPPLNRWVWATAVVLIVAVAGAAAAAIGLVRRASPPLRPAVEQSALQPKRRPQPPPSRIVEEPAPAPRRAEPRHPKLATTTPAAPSPDGAEVELFSQAVRAWKQQADAQAAIDLIREYQRRFPRGHFAGETIVIAVDALTSLGRPSEALRLLQQSALASVPRSLELHLMRGELSAQAGQCRQALADFEKVLEREQSSELAARALFGRASCRTRLSDESGAEADLRLYLERHPDGPQAAAARRALDR
jgi:TolA-binding protein